MRDLYVRGDETSTEEFGADSGGQYRRGPRLLAGTGASRRVWAAMGGALLAATCVGGLVLSGRPEASAPTQRALGTAPSAASGVKVGTVLVAYSGVQPDGYNLATIPQGWEVASADKLHLALAKTGVPAGPNFLDKILIAGDLNGSGLSIDPKDLPLAEGRTVQEVKVAGAPGRVILEKDGRTVHSLLYQTSRQAPRPQGKTELNGGKDAQGNKLSETVDLKVVVQLPPGLNWDVDTAVKFAAGVTIAQDAGGAVG